MDKIYTWKNWIHFTECLWIKYYFNNQIQNERTFKWILNKNERDSKYVIYPLECVELFKNIIQECEKKFQKKIKKTTQPILIYRYNEWIWFTIHSDNISWIKEVEDAAKNNQPLAIWDITIVIQINKKSDFEWWALHFPNHWILWQWDIWDFIAFPATSEYIHEVKPIQKWERYSLVIRTFFDE